MSACSDRARVNLLVADYAATDSANKINAIGGGFQVAGFDFRRGFSAPQSILAIIDVPADLEGEEFSVEVTLRDHLGELVSTPGPTGEPTHVRIASVITAERLRAPGISEIPRDWMWCRHQFVLTFASGIALTPRRAYEWRVLMDGETRPDWATWFCVPGQPTPPVIG